MIRRPRPSKPRNWCPGCGEDFSSTRAFDQHRVGNHQHLWHPDHEDGRRCLDQTEIRHTGMQRDRHGRWQLPLTDKQRLALQQISNRPPHEHPLSHAR